VSSDAPFAGVPMLVKDAVCHTAGDPYHFGMQVLKDIGWVETEDTYLARRFRRAGFVFLGKTNTPELAGSTTTEPLAYGATRNPWRLDASTLGSSGGSAAAVASGMVAVAHGNDMGGSIRLPAAACGLVGLKPSRGRVSQGPEFGEYMGPLTHEHVLTRTVRDTAAVLDVTSGYEAGDPYTAPPPASTFVAAAGRDPRPLRVGLLELPDDIAVAPESRDGQVVTGRLLEGLGHIVHALSCPPLWRGSRPFLLSCVAKSQELARLSARIGRVIQLDEVEPATAYLAAEGAKVTADDYVSALLERQAWAREVVAGWRAQADVLLLPTMVGPPPRLGELAPRSSEPSDLFPRIGRQSALAWQFNVTGEPAISLPLHQDSTGMPLGVQLVGPYGADELLLSLAGQLERASPWAGRLPARETRPYSGSSTLPARST
jgi:amidase